MYYNLFMDKKPLNVKKYYTYLTVFVTGAVVLVLEILGTRFVAPYYGTTIYVWSSLIAVTLLGLTAGYFAGGWLADRNATAAPMYYIILAAAAAVYLIPFTAPFILRSTNEFGPRLGSLAGSTALFIVPFILLGAVSPYAVKLSVGELKETGMTTGSLYGVSTIGGFLAAVLTGFYLIPAIGIKAIVDISAGLLAFVSLAWLSVIRKSKAPAALLCLAVFILIVSPHNEELTSTRHIEVLFKKQSLYSSIKVVDYMGRYRTLMIDNALQAFYDMQEKDYSVDYLKMFAAAAGYMKHAKTALSIGLGGGGMDGILREKGLEVDNVEIDPDIITVAKKYFGFNGSVVLDDGRHYAINSKKKYDLIIIDAFNGFAVAQFLLSKEAFMEMKNILNPGGILAVNTVCKYIQTGGAAGPGDRLVYAVNSTLKSVFKNVFVRADNYGIVNFVYYASDSGFKPDDKYIPVDIKGSGIVLTDDFNPVESLTAGLITEWRAEEIKRMGQVFQM
jgi:spermidine synthase